MGESLLRFVPFKNKQKKITKTSLLAGWFVATRTMKNNFFKRNIAGLQKSRVRDRSYPPRRSGWPDSIKRRDRITGTVSWSLRFMVARPKDANCYCNSVSYWGARFFSISTVIISRSNSWFQPQSSLARLSSILAGQLSAIF